MLRSHLLVAAAALTLVACDRAPTAPPDVGKPAVLPLPNVATVRGVLTTAMDSLGVESRTLTTADGTQYSLIGPNATLITPSEGQVVLVTGELADGAIFVESYQLINGDLNGCETSSTIVDNPTCLIRVDGRRRP